MSWKVHAPSWGPDYLENMVGILLGRLPADTLAQVERFLHDNNWGWGSTCSGTDSPAFVFAAAARHLRGRHINLEPNHIFSAEMDECKRAFITRHASPKELYVDVADVCKPKAWNVAGKTAEYIQPDSHKEVKQYLSGFSCKSVSGLNPGASETCIDNACMQTGETFAWVERYLKTARPMCALLENVFGLKRGKQHLKIKQKLERHGYFVHILELTPLTFGIPQSRPRLWYVVIRRDVMAERTTDKIYGEFIDDMMKHLVGNGFHLMDINSFLRDDLAAVVAKHAPKEEVGTTTRAGWPRRHEAKWQRASSASAADCQWKAELGTTYPEYVRLPDRMKELLTMRQISYPHPTKCVLNLSQGEVSKAEGYTPCLTPQGFFWLAWKCREMRGVEVS